jgi:hypothetical protein
MLLKTTYLGERSSEKFRTICSLLEIREPIKRCLRVLDNSTFYEIYYIENKEEFIEQLHSVKWHYSQSSGSSQLHRQKHTKCNKNGNTKNK